MEQLDQVIKALESAVEGSAELERMIADALDMAQAADAGSCTRSVDAALGLLPPAGYWELMSLTNDGLSQFACEVHPDNNRPPVIGVGRTAALAVCAAAFKARRDGSVSGLP